MVKIPSRFKRVADAFDHASRAFNGMSESSGSEHSAAGVCSADNLSYLVASFLEKEGNVIDRFEAETNIDKCSVDDNMLYPDDDDLESLDRLRDLLLWNDNVTEHGITVKIRSEVEHALGLIGNKYTYVSEEFKRELMSHLRERDFDAGLCKSRWKKSGNRPAGDHQYVDVMDSSGERYMVEVHLAGIFEIARPTERFSSILAMFPLVYVGRPDDMRKLVRIMCGEMKQSMKSSGLSMPPWRRNSYMQSKWFGSYRRTANRTSMTTVAKNIDDHIGGELEGEAGSSGKTSTSFAVLPSVNYRYQDCCLGNNRMRIGQLTAALSQKSRA